MDEQLKRRLVGALVLVSLAVIFVPMLFEEREGVGVRIESSNIPPRPPQDEAFHSRILPREGAVPLAPPERAAHSRPPTDTGDSPTDETALQPRVGLSAWVIQVASLSNGENAEKLVQELRDKGYSAFLEQVYVSGKQLYRIRVGPEVDRKRAERMLQEIHEKVRIMGQVIRYP